MNVIDSSAWLEYLSDGVNADYFTPPIQDPLHLITPTICFYEVFKRVFSQFGEERALQAISIMSTGMISDLNQQIAIEAALISVELKLAMADSIILATARAHNATLWTQDVHFKGLEGVNYLEKKG